MFVRIIKKVVLLFLKISTFLLLSRPFGAIIYDIAAKYDGRISHSDLRKLEKILIKTRKSELDYI